MNEMDAVRDREMLEEEERIQSVSLVWSATRESARARASRLRV